MDTRVAGRVTRPAGAHPGHPGSSTGRFRYRGGAQVVGLLVLAALVGGWLGRAGAAPVPLLLGWAFSPTSNTVTVRLTSAAGTPARQVLAHSRLTVSENGRGHLERSSADGGTVQVPVPPGTRSSLLIRVAGPHPMTQTLIVVAPPPLRVVASRAGSGRWVASMSSPLRRQLPQRLCGTDTVSFPALSQVAVSEGAAPCQDRLLLTARDGERAAVPVSIPARPQAPVRAVSQAPLYCFARSAGRAIYITIDDGWVPSARVLEIMRQTHLPVTAFLIAQAARQHLSYWRDFVAAGGMIGDHTVSHPNLTGLTLAQARAQWAQDRAALGRWLGQTPLLGRPPYGAFDRRVEVAAARGGLTALVGWSATVSRNRVETWDGKPLRAGEIVILHWVPGLGRQLAALLAVIRARHLRPAPLTSASFAGITPQTRSLNGD